MCMMPRTWTLSKRRTGGAIALMNAPFARNSSHAFPPHWAHIITDGHCTWGSWSRSVTQGRPAILSSLKTLLEIGELMPETIRRWAGKPA